MRRLWAAGRAYHRAHLASVRLPGGAWSGSLPTSPSRPPTWSCRGRPYRPDPTLDTARRRRAAPADPRDLHRLRGGRPHLPGGLVPRAGAGVRQHDPGDRHHRHRVPGLPRPRRPDRRAAGRPQRPAAAAVRGARAGHRGVRPRPAVRVRPPRRPLPGCLRRAARVAGPAHRGALRARVPRRRPGHAADGHDAAGADPARGPLAGGDRHPARRAVRGQHARGHGRHAAGRLRADRVPRPAAHQLRRGAAEPFGGPGRAHDGAGGGAAATGRLAGRRRAVLLATFVSGFVALALEVLWTRMLAEGTGSNIYIFTAILAAFLAGIALGSALYRCVSGPGRDLVGVLGLCLAGVGVAALVTVVIGSGVVGRLPFLSETVAVLLPATVLMGYGFPLAGRLITRSTAETGGSVGLLYAANTAGSILGSFSAAFVLAGTLGTNGSVLLLGAVDLLVGAALMVTEPAWRARAVRLAGAGLALLAVVAVVASSLQVLLTRTVTENDLRAGGLPVTHDEDRLATVDTVAGPGYAKRLLVGGVGMTSLTVDTKLMAYLPKALRPEARDFLVICFGMGSTYRSGLKLGLRTDAVELSPTVPSRMPVFFPDADSYLHHPNGHVTISDGRNYVRLSRKRYDMVAVDPAPPIESAGPVVPYTREFLTEGRARKSLV